MKCPKCAYLGFDTGDRCKNCGYDFSLVWTPAIDRRDGDDLAERRLSLEPDYEFRRPGEDEASIQVNADVQEPARSSPNADLPLSMTFDKAPLPLFTPRAGDDEPLVKVPTTPRAPLAVRRAIDSPRVRSTPRASRPSPDPVLQFADEPAVAPGAPPNDGAPLGAAARSEVVTRSGVVTPVPRTNDIPSGHVGARVLAAAVDHLILFGIDLGVVYFTVRMAGLSMGEWRLLPPAPMLAFLAFLKLSYFFAFTAVGGQTIGKMAAGTCVVADDGSGLNAGRAMRRTCAGLVSALLFGLGWVPALFGRGLALHDRIAHTRVVPLRSL